MAKVRKNIQYLLLKKWFVYIGNGLELEVWYKTKFSFIGNINPA